MATETRKDLGWTPFIIMFFGLLAGVCGGLSLSISTEHLNGWQAGAYALVAGVFIGLATIILYQILSSVKE